MSSLLPRTHKSKYRDTLVYFFAFATPLFMIPQAVKIFSEQSAEGVSLLTWVFFLLADVIWITYGIKHKLRPLIFGHMLYFAVESVVIVGIMTYS